MVLRNYFKGVESELTINTAISDHFSIIWIGQYSLALSYMHKKKYYFLGMQPLKRQKSTIDDSLSDLICL